MGKKVKLNVGVEDRLEQVTVEIPDTAPRPWDGKDRLKYIGGHVPRVDGKAKTTGGAKYTCDIKLRNMLYAGFLRSRYPSALVEKIDTSRARKVPGVRAIIPVQEQLPMPVRINTWIRLSW